jgi:predicted secreted protein
MYCTSCGHELPPGAIACTSCGQGIPHFPPPPNVPNYLIQSILATLCCCLPLGVVALVYASQVNTKLAAGDVAGAEASSRSARTWVIVAVIAGIVTGAGFAALSFWQS